jgi:hypothetical protein
VYHNEVAGLNDDEANLRAQRALKGDGSAYQNVGRGAQGAENIAKIDQQVIAIGRAQGLTNEQIASNMAFAKQNMAGGMAAQRTLGTQEARMGSAGFEAKGAISLARQAISNVPRTGFLPFNNLIQGYQSQTLNPDQAELYTRTQGVINTYSSVMSRGSNVTTDSSRARAQDLLNTASNPETYNRVLDTMESEINMALNSPEQMRQFYRQHYGTGSVGATQQPGSPQGSDLSNAATGGAAGSGTPYTAATGPGGGASVPSNSSAAPPAGAPQNAKQAPDGNWYVPDPNRPGKYLQFVQ